MQWEEIGERLSGELPAPFCGAKTEFWERIDSTQTRAKQLFHQGVERSLIVAAEQTGGYGRMRRPFASPETGIYFTFAFPWRMETAVSISPTILTTAVALALREAMDAQLSRACAIKWVNDLFYHQRKICGILAETILHPNQPPALFCGVGINWSGSEEDFPPELREIAGTLELSSPQPEDVFRLLKDFFQRLAVILGDLPDTSFLHRYEEHLLGIGKKGRLSDGREGVLLGVDAAGGLRMRIDGQETIVRTGEVRLSAWGLE